MYEGMLAETVMMKGYNGDTINAYFARPLGPGPFPGMVLINHMPGWDEWYREATRRFAHHGYMTISPNIFFRFGHGTPEDVAAKARTAGGAPDDQVVGDAAGARDFVSASPDVERQGRRLRDVFGGAPCVPRGVQEQGLRRRGRLLGRARRDGPLGAEP